MRFAEMYAETGPVEYVPLSADQLPLNAPITKPVTVPPPSPPPG